MYSETKLRRLPCYHCIHCVEARKLQYGRFTERKCDITNRWGRMDKSNCCTKFENKQSHSSDHKYNGFLVRKDQIEDYRTENQWLEDGFVVKKNAVGTEMYASRMSAMNNGRRFIYYLPDQVKRK